MLLWLAENIEPEPKQGLLRSAFGLWAMTVTIGVILMVALAAVLAARRARRAAMSLGAKRRRGRPIPDAWAEAGRRIEPIRLDEPPPDVLPEDRP